jgi:hypothetical protein
MLLGLRFPEASLTPKFHVLVYEHQRMLKEHHFYGMMTEEVVACCLLIAASSGYANVQLMPACCCL